MHDVTITGVNRFPNPTTNANGNTAIAHFDAVVNGLRMTSCTLVKTAKGGLTVYAPLVHKPHTNSAVHFVDDSLRHCVMMKARDAYRAIGGTDIDSIGASGPIGPYRSDSQED